MDGVRGSSPSFHQLSAQTSDKAGNALGVQRNPPQTDATKGSMQMGNTMIKPLTKAQQNMQAHRAKLQQGNTGGLLNQILGRSEGSRTGLADLKRLNQEHGSGVDASGIHKPAYGDTTEGLTRPLTKAQINMQAHREKLQQGGSGTLRETLAGGKTGGIAQDQAHVPTEQKSVPAEPGSVHEVADRAQDVFEQALAPPPQEVAVPREPQLRGLPPELQGHQDKVDAAISQLKETPHHAVPLQIGEGADAKHFLAYMKATGDAQVVKFTSFSGIVGNRTEAFPELVAKGAMGIVQKATKSGAEGLKAVKTAIGATEKQLGVANADVKNEHVVLAALHQSHPDGQVPGFQKAPRLVQFGSAEKPSYGVMTHFYGGGDLKGNAEKLSKEQMLTGFATVADGLAFMHGQNMAHLDIKPQNIFIEGGKFFLGDFGGVQGDFANSLNFSGGTAPLQSNLDYAALGKLETSFKQATTNEEKTAIIDARNKLASQMDMFALGLSIYSSVVGGKDAGGMDASPFTRSKVVQGVGGYCQLNTDSRVSAGPRGKNLPELQKGCSPEMQAVLASKLKGQAIVLDGAEYHQIIAEKQASLGEAGVAAFKKLAKAPLETITADGKKGFEKIAQEYGQEVSDLVQRMVSENPDQRPTAAECQAILSQVKIAP